MKLAKLSDQILLQSAAIYNNPKYKTPERKKKLLVDMWNSLTGAYARAVADPKLKSIYMGYGGMVTWTIAQMLELDELMAYIGTIARDMPESRFIYWKRRK